MKNSEVHLFTPEPQPMPVAGAVLGDAVKKMLADRGVVFHPLHKLTRVDSAANKIVFDGRESFYYDLLVAIPPHRGPHLARESGLVNEAGQMGWTWHVGKVLFKQWWLTPYGLRREVLRQMLHLGGKALGVPTIWQLYAALKLFDVASGNLSLLYTQSLPTLHTPFINLYFNREVSSL